MPNFELHVESNLQYAPQANLPHLWYIILASVPIIDSCDGISMGLLSGLIVVFSSVSCLDLVASTGTTFNFDIFSSVFE